MQTAKLGFGATAGAAAGWTVGKFLGCLMVIALCVAAVVALGLVAQITGGSSGQASRTETAKPESQDTLFHHNCVQSFSRSFRDQSGVQAPEGMADQYCDCALKIARQTGSAEKAADLCASQILNK